METRASVGYRRKLAVWHDLDDLVTKGSLTAEGVREWLQADNALV